MQEPPDVWEQLAHLHQTPDPLSWDDVAHDLSSAVMNMVRRILSVVPWLFHGVEDYEDMTQDVILNVYRVGIRCFEKHGAYPWSTSSECQDYFWKACSNRVTTTRRKGKRFEQLLEADAEHVRDCDTSEPSVVVELHEIWRFIANRESSTAWATAYLLWRAKFSLREIEQITGISHSTFHERAPQIHAAVLAHFA